MLAVVVVVAGVDVDCPAHHATQSLNHSITHSLTHSVTHHPVTRSLHSLHSLHSLIHSLSHSFTHSLIHSFTHSLIQSVSHNADGVFLLPQRAAAAAGTDTARHGVSRRAGGGAQQGRPGPVPASDEPARVAACNQPRTRCRGALAGFGGARGPNPAQLQPLGRLLERGRHRHRGLQLREAQALLGACTQPPPPPLAM
jgi:hypothetical protein